MYIHVSFEGSEDELDFEMSDDDAKQRSKHERWVLVQVYVGQITTVVTRAYPHKSSLQSFRAKYISRQMF